MSGWEAEYELLDWGDGRKLERFGTWITDRPTPAAEGRSRHRPELWQRAHGRFLRGRQKDQGTWRGELPERWSLQCGVFQLELKPTPFGHLGVFPEQSANWQWIARQVARSERPLRVLNLFAYTGGSTLAAAAAGAAVTHVDAARNVVQWARRNAELSGLADAPIRWISEDASQFVARELRRGRSYDAVILDPPSYGHGPRGQRWRVHTDLLPLLRQCGELTGGQRQFMLLTCHSPGLGPAELSASLADAVFGHCQAGGTAKRLRLPVAEGEGLDAGCVVRWP